MAGFNFNEYIETIIDSRILQKLPLKKDQAFMSTATRMLELRNEMEEVERTLALQKEDFTLKMKGLAVRRAELERKEYELRLTLAKFDKFFLENDEKKFWAIKKADEERELGAIKGTEIEKLEAEKEKLQLYRDKVKQHMIKHKIYQKYMSNVLESTNAYREMRDILARYDTLKMTSEDLMAIQRKNNAEIESLQEGLAQCSEEKYREMLTLNLNIAELQVHLEKAATDASAKEALFNDAKAIMTDKMIFIRRIKIGFPSTVTRARTGKVTQTRRPQERPHPRLQVIPTVVVFVLLFLFVLLSM